MARDTFQKRRRALIELCRVVKHDGHLQLKLSKKARRMVDDLKTDGLAYWGEPRKKLPRHRQGAFYSMFTIKLG